MHYVLVVCDNEEDSSYLGQGFDAQPGQIPLICMNKGKELLDFASNRPLNEPPFLIILDQYPGI